MNVEDIDDVVTNSRWYSLCHTHSQTHITEEPLAVLTEDRLSNTCNCPWHYGTVHSAIDGLNYC